jgi:omega-amidase
MLMKIAAVQARMGLRLGFEEKLHIFKQRPDFVCLPEYWLIDGNVPDFHRAALLRSDHLSYFTRLSDELGCCLVGGTLVEPDEDHLYNTGYIIDRGTILGRYRKRYPVAGELAKGITPGSTSLVVSVDNVRIGILICGDVFEPQTYEEMGRAGVDIIFIPTTSPYRPEDSLSRKHERDQRYFVSGAEKAGAYIVKACGVGAIFGHRLQGRSLIAAPWGIVSRVSVQEEDSERILVTTLDIDELRDFRRRYRQSESKFRVSEPSASSRTTIK